MWAAPCGRQRAKINIQAVPKRLPDPVAEPHRMSPTVNGHSSTRCVRRPRACDGHARIIAARSRAFFTRLSRATGGRVCRTSTQRRRPTVWPIGASFCHASDRRVSTRCTARQRVELLPPWRTRTRVSRQLTLAYCPRQAVGEAAPSLSSQWGCRFRPGCLSNRAHTPVCLRRARSQNLGTRSKRCTPRFPGSRRRRQGQAFPRRER